jgi:undecaprenyl-diphosphatase
MITYLQAIILGLLQGITELFPISSLGHSILLPAIFGWNLNMQASAMVEFLVATHFATALALFIFYWDDWMKIIGGFFRSLGNWKLVSAPVAGEGGGLGGGSVHAKLAWLLIIGTIPAGIIGFIFQKKLEALFVNPGAVAFILILNGVLLFVAEMTRRGAEKRRGKDWVVEQLPNESTHGSDARIARLNWWDAFKVGCMEILALIPGFSRTGATFAGSLWEGLSHEDSLRFSFLLATPIIGAAALLELPKLAHAGGALIAVSFAGAVAAFIAALISAKILVRWFHTRTLLPFAVYCVLIGVLGLIVVH